MQAHKKIRRVFLAALGVAIAWGSSHAAARIDDYPNRPITVVVPYPPGGSADMATRIVAAELSKKVGQTVVVENRAGGGGIVGVGSVARSTPDGYTLAVGVSGILTLWPALGQEMPFSPLKDLAPITLMVDNPLVIAGNKDLAPKTMTELLEYGKQQKQPLPFGSGGQGTAMHLAGALLSKETGVELSHIPYRGTNPALQDVLAGHVPLAIIDAATARELVAQGEVRGFATTGAQRSPTMPELPTVAESGVPGFVVTSWFGLLAPSGTPEEIVDFLYRQVDEILKRPDIQERFIAAGLEPATMPPQEFRNLIESQISHYREVVRESNITID
ncbi:MAG: tripartite tricarboxylate transporter substrate binding protein [Pigmentiphaga sp.]|nr:tripartite tricarboxylate transporter substrate binding protein [Pigmentiphaga sp.]